MSFIVGSHDFDLYQLRFKVYFTFFGKSLKNFWKAVEFFEADNLKQNQSVTFKNRTTEKIHFWLGSNITRQSQDSNLRRLGKNQNASTSELSRSLHYISNCFVRPHHRYLRPLSAWTQPFYVIIFLVLLHLRYEQI